MPEVDRLNCAVRTCLNQCIGDEAPIARLAEFRVWLLRQPEWREREVNAVEIIARRLLEALSDKADLQMDRLDGQAG
jgi:hypothetical protein